MKIAVVGASNDPEKYGNRIVRNLLHDGHDVYPVNLRERTILGQPAFEKVADIGKQLDIVDIVVPPAQTLKVLKQLRKLHRIDVWVQPGAESDDVIQYLEKHSSDYGRITYNMCIMTSLARVYPETKSF